MHSSLSSLLPYVGTTAGRSEVGQPVYLFPLRCYALLLRNEPMKRCGFNVASEDQVVNVVYRLHMHMNDARREDVLRAVMRVENHSPGVQ